MKQALSCLKKILIASSFNYSMYFIIISLTNRESPCRSGPPSILTLKYHDHNFRFPVSSPCLWPRAARCLGAWCCWPPPSASPSRSRSWASSTTSRCLLLTYLLLTYLLHINLLHTYCILAAYLLLTTSRSSTGQSAKTTTPPPQSPRSSSTPMNNSTTWTRRSSWPGRWVRTVIDKGGVSMQGTECLVWV